MLHIRFTRLIFFAAAAFIIFSFIKGSETAVPHKQAELFLREHVNHLFSQVTTLERSAADAGTKKDSLIAQYRQMRQTYKTAELLIEYYMPATAKMINGALVTEADEEEGTQNIFEPEGLQVIEENVFSDSIDRISLSRECKRLKAAMLRLRHLAQTQEMADWQLIDAMQLEVIRVMCLNIAGYDAPASGDAIIETTYALTGMQQVLRFTVPLYEKTSTVKKADKLLSKAISYTKTNPDFDSFNRMEFIRAYMNPLYALIVDLAAGSKEKPLVLPDAINKQAQSLFTNTSFKPDFYAPNLGTDVSSRSAAIELGKYLFFDPVLSHDMNRSCASCHQPEKGFTDGLPKALALSGNKLGRNTPTILNAALQANLFWDSRVTYLEEQIENVTNNIDELHGNFDEAVSRLIKSDAYKTLFKRAFKGKADTMITASGIRTAIAAYERSLVSMNSRFDRHIRGEAQLLSLSEINGFNLFMGKAACGTCHFMPLFNGTVPPQYSKTEWEVLGTPANDQNKELDEDLGRYHVKKMDWHKYAFKTPTVRNAALTAPYMHNGCYQTLEQVMDFYNKGGGKGMGMRLDNQTLPFDELNLSEAEQKDMIAFMRSLTDTSGMTNIPVSLPAIDDADASKRKVGGTY